jgi:hypothetical protein
METSNGRRTQTLLILAIGIIVGLLIAGGLALVKSGLSNKKESQIQETRGLLLTISNPIDGGVVTSETLAVSGTTGKDAVVVITGGTDDVITQTSGGNFSATIKLVEGENQLSVYAFDISSGESIQAPLSILYLKEEVAAGRLLVAESSTNDTNTSKERIEQLRQQLATKSSELKKASTAADSHTIGTISGISGKTLTIETNLGQIKTAFTNDLTKFFSIGSSGRTAIVLTDLKIGDRVALVGITKDDSSGLAKDVVRLEQTPTKRHAVAGKVKSADGPTLTLSDLANADRTYTVKIGNETTIKVKAVSEATINDVKVSDTVVVSGTVEKDGSLTAKQLFDVPGAPKTTSKESTSSASPSASP